MESNCIELKNDGTEDLGSEFERRLIEAVKEQTCLYAKDHQQYHNKPYRNIAWLKVSKIFNKSTLDCMNKWYSLLQRFWRISRQVSLGNANVEELKWPPYVALKEIQSQMVESYVDLVALRMFPKFTISQQRGLLNQMELNRKELMNPLTPSVRREQIWTNMADKLNALKYGAPMAVIAWQMIWWNIKQEVKEECKHGRRAKGNNIQETDQVLRICQITSKNKQKIEAKLASSVEIDFDMNDLQQAPQYNPANDDLSEETIKQVLCDVCRKDFPKHVLITSDWSSSAHHLIPRRCRVKRSISMCSSCHDTLKAKASFAWKTCRICAESNQGLENFLSISYDHTRNIFFEVTGLRFSMSDGLPRFICAKCRDDLMDFNKFYVNFTKAQETLQRIHARYLVEDRDQRKCKEKRGTRSSKRITLSQAIISPPGRNRDIAKISEARMAQDISKQVESSKPSEGPNTVKTLMKASKYIIKRNVCSTNQTVDPQNVVKKEPPLIINSSKRVPIKRIQLEAQPPQNGPSNLKDSSTFPSSKTVKTLLGSLEQDCSNIAGAVPLKKIRLVSEPLSSVSVPGFQSSDIVTSCLISSKEVSKQEKEFDSVSLTRQTSVIHNTSLKSSTVTSDNSSLATVFKEILNSPPPPNEPPSPQALSSPLSDDDTVALYVPLENYSFSSTFTATSENAAVEPNICKAAGVKTTTTQSNAFATSTNTAKQKISASQIKAAGLTLKAPAPRNADVTGSNRPASRLDVTAEPTLKASAPRSADVTASNCPASRLDAKHIFNTPASRFNLGGLAALAPAPRGNDRRLTLEVVAQRLNVAGAASKVPAPKNAGGSASIALVRKENAAESASGLNAPASSVSTIPSAPNSNPSAIRPNAAARASNTAAAGLNASASSFGTTAPIPTAYTHAPLQSIAGTLLNATIPSLAIATQSKNLGPADLTSKNSTAAPSLNLPSTSKKALKTELAIIDICTPPRPSPSRRCLQEAEVIIIRDDTPSPPPEIDHEQRINNLNPLKYYPKYYPNSIGVQENLLETDIALNQLLLDNPSPPPPTQREEPIKIGYASSTLLFDDPSPPPPTQRREPVNVDYLSPSMLINYAVNKAFRLNERANFTDVVQEEEVRTVANTNPTQNLRKRRTETYPEQNKKP